MNEEQNKEIGSPAGTDPPDEAGPLTYGKSDIGFLCAVFALTFVYLVFQTLYIERFPLVMDEFQGGQVVYELLDKLPYRDELPYKTVLGYYIQLPALLLAEPHWPALMSVKTEMAWVNALTLVLASLALARIMKRSAVAWSLLLLVSMSTFLERSSDLRVDMLTSVFGLASFLLLLHRRHRWAGFAVAVSFLVSQKGVFFVPRRWCCSAGLGSIAGAKPPRPSGARRLLRSFVPRSDDLPAGLVDTELVRHGPWRDVLRPWRHRLSGHVRHPSLLAANHRTQSGLLWSGPGFVRQAGEPAAPPTC